MARAHLVARLVSLSGLVITAAAGCAHAAAQDLAPRHATDQAAPESPPAVSTCDGTGATPGDEHPCTPLPIPAGRLIATLDAAACTSVLVSHGVRFEPLAPEDAPGVAQPIRLRGPIDGVVIEPRSASRVHAILDCRLAVALLAWAPALRAAGIDRIQHYSAFRPGARIHSNGRPSGHSNGLAIDSALYRERATPGHDADPRVLDVLTDWAERERGGPPCPVRESEPGESRVLRSVVCAAVQADLFQVVLTPHFDAAHQNHIHLEVVPGVDWSYVH